MQDRSVGEAPAPTPPIAAGGAPAPTSAVSNRRALAQQYWQAAAYWKTKEGKGAMDLAQHYADQAVKAEPVLDKTEVHTLPGTNQRVVVKIYKDGSHEVVPELAPDLGKLMLVNNGKYQIGVDDITGDHRLSVENTLSPHDEKMLPLEERRTLATESNARATQAQAGLAQQRLAWEQQGGAGQLEKDANGNLVRVRGTAAEPVTQGGEPVKAFQQMPEGLREKLAQNTVTLSKIDEALGGLAKHPAAVGPSNMLPMADTWKQYTDPKGVELRAIIAGIGGQKFHDLSGAAVSVSEAARLKPYIPSVDDGPHKSAIKLANLKRELDLMNAELARGVPLAQVINRTPTAGTKYEGFSAEAHQ